MIQRKSWTYFNNIPTNGIDAYQKSRGILYPKYRSPTGQGCIVRSKSVRELGAAEDAKSCHTLSRVVGFLKSLLLSKLTAKRLLCFVLM